MAERFSLKDHLFNPETLGQLAKEYQAGLPGFDGDGFAHDALSGFPERELLARLDWMADCLEPHLASDFPSMADQLEAAMPAPLDPARTDDDFGQFIHALPGILAVRHGLEQHRERALDLLHAATQRFSMEFYIRPFLNQWPKETLARLADWAVDDNYHVRRLVSEGTRPKLPWAKAVTLSPDQTLPLLDRLHADRTRYVTRSVANHLNDLTKSHPDLAMDRLDRWAATRDQSIKELDWMTRHALRTRVKAGHPRAMKMLGFDPDAPITVSRFDVPERVRIGETLNLAIELRAKDPTPVIVDYILWRRTAGGGETSKVFKWKQTKVDPDTQLRLEKRHKLKGDATTFTLYPGPHRVELQINGRVSDSRSFELL